MAIKVTGNIVISDTQAISNITTITANGNFSIGTANANVGNLGTNTAIITTGNITTINSGLLQNGAANLTLASSGINFYPNANSPFQVNLGNAANDYFQVIRGDTYVWIDTGLHVAPDYLGEADQGAFDMTYDLANSRAYFRLPRFAAIRGNNNLRFDIYANTGLIDAANVLFMNNTAVNVSLPLGVNGNITGNYFIGNGSQLTGISAGFPLANGTSNINAPAVNGNINISVGGTANVLITTATGVNVTGTLNATGNANVNNLGTAQVLATANVTAPQLISNVSTGTAPLVVTSTTVVANLNSNALQGNTPSQSATANSIAQRNADGNITANFYIGNGSQLTGISASVSFPLANGTSNINIPTASGNINFSIGGSANEVVFTSTGANVNGTLDVTGLITGNGNGLTQLNASNIATGTLGVGRGGLGITTTPTNGQIPIGNGTTYVAATITGTANQVTVTNGAGTITLATPQSINTSSDVQFNSLGVGTAGSATAGEIRATNNITAYYSDDRLKTRIGIIEEALDKIKQLNGFYYTASELAESLGYTKKREVGLSAQEVQKVLPEVVTTAPIDDKYLTIWYEKVIPLLVEGIKELAVEVDYLKKYCNGNFF